MWCFQACQGCGVARCWHAMHVAAWMCGRAVWWRGIAGVGSDGRWEGGAGMCVTEVPRWHVGHRGVGCGHREVGTRHESCKDAVVESCEDAPFRAPKHAVMSVLCNPATCSHVEGGGVYGSRSNSATHPTWRWDCDPCKVKGTMYIPERKRDGLLSQLAAAGLHRHTDTMSGPWSSTAPPTS